MYRNYMEDKTEQEMLEMAEQFKECIKEKDIEHHNMKAKYMDSKKTIAYLYGQIFYLKQKKMN